MPTTDSFFESMEYDDSGLIWAPIAQQISNVTGQALVIRSVRPMHGGSINSASVIEGDDRRFFVKHNDPSRLDMFRAEAAGLQEIRSTLTLKVPTPICCGRTRHVAYIVLEYLALGDGETAAEQFGWRLAAMHQHSHDRFGWHLHNTIGTTPQINTPGDDWPSFLRAHRLGYQLALAAQHGYRQIIEPGERLLERLSVFFQDYRPRPSLLHGDLWAGNYAADGNGQPVVFDPAVYYGDREADIAMTELFGRLPDRFYEAYRHALPLDPGYTVRRDLYNLYHILNHLNLFGPGYLEQANRLIRRLLAAS
ncbi:MAG: fructosamine kinase family protein [Acidiferrobacteraceae bacterium]